MTKLKSFVIHTDSLTVLDDLSDEQAGQLFRAIRAYHLDADFDCDTIVKVAFSPFKNQFIRDEQKYEAVVNRNRKNGKKGGRPVKTTTSEITQDNPENPSGFSGNPDEPKKADSNSNSNSNIKDKDTCPSSDGNANASKTHSDGNANHKPITNNHKPNIKDLFDADRIIPIWNSLGCQQHRGLTQKACKAIEKTYSQYCKQSKSPHELNDWLESYLLNGFAKWMTNHHRQMNDGQWAADLEFAVRLDTYDKVKNTVVA